MRAIQKSGSYVSDGIRMNPGYNRRRVMGISIAIAILLLIAFTSSCRHARDKGLTECERLVLDGDTVAAQSSLDSLAKSGADVDFIKAMLDVEKKNPSSNADYFKKAAIRFGNDGDEYRRTLSLYYLGKALYNARIFKTATAALKDAEQSAEELGDPQMQWYISRMLFLLNLFYGDHQLSLDYATLAYDVAAQLRDTLKLYKSITYRSEAMRSLDRYDEAVRIMLSAKRLENSLGIRQKAGLYNNIGNALIDSLPDQAAGYFQKSLSYVPLNVAMANLAHVYGMKGRTLEADSLRLMAYKSADQQQRIEILTDMFRQWTSQRRFEEACRVASMVISSRDSLTHATEKSGVVAQQLEWEHASERQRTESAIKTLIVVVVISLLVAALVILWLLYRRARLNEAFTAQRLAAETLTQRICELEAMAEKENADHDSEISRLNHRLDRIKEKQTHAFVNGCQRWKEISGNGTIVTWKKNDLEDCVDYYSVIDTAYMSALDTMYSGLTTKNKLFMILLHNGKSDAQIRDIFGVSPNAVRTIRSRIKGKLVSLPPDRS